LHRASLEGARLVGAKLGGARDTHANLQTAKLGGADLTGALLGHADLSQADLSTAVLANADLANANLEAANLDEAVLRGANLRDVQMGKASLRRSKLVSAGLVNVQLSSADATGADFSEADLRRANLSGARLDGATFTGAKIAGVVGTGASIDGLRAVWVDASVDADGSKRLDHGDAQGLLIGKIDDASANGVSKRYFGRGDVLRNALLEFGAGASVEVESRFEGCTISLGEGTQFVVGEHGVLDGCQIRGAGSVMINGRFEEAQSPGIDGANLVSVSARGTLIGAVAQPPERTAFAFEPGCVLRMKITNAKTQRNGRTR
jgi:uncharacterized protein YjbI with pentapeptide repeats